MKSKKLSTAGSAVAETAEPSTSNQPSKNKKARTTMNDTNPVKAPAKRVKKSVVSVEAKAPLSAALVASPEAPSGSTPTAAGASPAPVSGIAFILPPPASANIPAAPQGAAPPGGGNYRSVMPKATESAVLPAALEDLKRFSNFAQIFGMLGLPYAEVIQAFDVSNQWTEMRVATDNWDAYCQTQEGIAWGSMRSLMSKMKPAFDLAVAADPSLALTYPNLALLFGAKRAIAQKGVATKRANKAAAAAGKPTTHGAVGKRREKSALKALKQQTQTSGAALPNPSPPIAVSTGANPVATPVAAPPPGHS